MSFPDWLAKLGVVILAFHYGKTLSTSISIVLQFFDMLPRFLVLLLE
jgi:hypothetical protein